MEIPHANPRDKMNFEANEDFKIELRVIGNEEIEYIDEAFRMLTVGSWTEKELAGFDLKEELINEKTHKVGLFVNVDGKEKLIGFAGASTLGTPNYFSTNEYPKDGQDVWCGYFVIHPDLRNRLDVLSSIKRLHDAVLGYALGATEHGGKIYACTEKDFVKAALPRLGWVFRGDTPIVDKNRTVIDDTAVFEYINPLSHIVAK